MKPGPPRKAASKLDGLLQYNFEKLANRDSKVPDGYVFVPKGDVFITRHCRTLTGQLGKTLYIVYDDISHNRLGLHCPKEVWKEVERDAAASAPGRHAAVEAKDSRDIERARNAILRLFPQIPPSSCQAVLNHGFRKGSGRVGRSTVLDDDHKVTLAIVAHVRHTMTPYDTLLRELDRDGVGEETRREKARGMIRGCVEAVLSQWRSSSPNTVLNPVREHPKAKPSRLENLKGRSQKKISSGCRGPLDTKLNTITKGAASASLGASIYAVRSKSTSSQNTILPATTPATRRTNRTILHKTMGSAITRGQATTRGRDSQGGLSTTHLRNLLEASIFATGSSTGSLSKTDKIPSQRFRATRMAGHNSLNKSNPAVKHALTAPPTMNNGTQSKFWTDHVWDFSQKKRPCEVDEGTSKAKRIRGEEATAGAPVDVEDCYALTAANSL